MNIRSGYHQTGIAYLIFIKSLDAFISWHTRTITRKDNHRGTRVIYRHLFCSQKSDQLFSFLQELGLSNDGNESAVHGQTVSPGQSPIHLQTTNLGQIDTVVLDEQRASGYPAVVAYQRSVFISLVHNMLRD